MILVLEALKQGCYRVYFEDQVLIERSRDPEHEACRALLALGYTGKVETWREGAIHPSMTLDIEIHSNHTTEESPTVGPRFRYYRARPTVASGNDVSRCAVALPDGDLKLAATLA